MTAGRRPARRAKSSGSALVAVIVILALLLASTGATLVSVRSHLWAAGRARAVWQARASAEAGAWHALSLVGPGTSFAEVVAGTGGLARPSLAGPLPAAGGWSWFPGPPFGYAAVPVALPASASGAERMAIDVEATAVRSARRRLRATIGRATLPYLPAVLVLVDGGFGIEPGARLSVDARLTSGSAPAALAAADRSSSEALLARLLAAGAVVRGDRTTAVADPVDVAAWLRAGSPAPVDAASLGAAFGATAPPAARVTTGGIAGALAGRGVVVSSGDLEIRGRVDFAGVILVAGELRLSSPDCAIAGMVWARSLRTAGCALRADGAAVTSADALLHLPREAILLGLGEG